MITEREIRKAAEKLKNNKSPFSDKISNKMIKASIDTLMPVYEKLFNSILNQGTMPQTWCGGLISPIYKSGGRGDPANYRGICVSSCKFENCKTDAVIIRILTDVSAMLPSSGYTRLNTVRGSLNLACVIDGILARVQHEIARYGAQVSKEKRGEGDSRET